MFWSLDHREFDALKRQWAFARAEMLNLQANTDGVPFTIEDVMDPESRSERVAEIKAREQTAKIMAEIENFKLGQLKSGVGKVDDDGVPEWMKKAPRRFGNGKR
jgi:hypothetical protein